MPDGTSVDQLYIEVNAKASKANDAIDRLCGKLDRLSISLRKVNGAQLTGLATGVQRLGSAMNTMNQVKTADFTRLATNLTKMGNIDVAKLNSASVSISHIGKAINNIGPVSENAQKFGELAKGIAQLGYKSSTKALENIPKLAIAMRDLMTTLSKAPKVSQNLIDMTNALAKLARTGSSSGKAVTSLSNSFNLFSRSSKKAQKHSFSLASAIGKVYATYWLLFRLFGKLKDAIDISSKLTEVQNVVDVTFGKYRDVVEEMSKTSITEFGMSELTVKEVSSRFQAMGTAMGFAQGEMADTSIELTKLAADMASFYNVEQKDVAEDLASIFTGQTRPLRTYGLDLTEATLKEWALKNGMDANIKSMSQMEKATLRYQYVMANTGAAQGDFARTANTWANQVRILKQNFQQLGSIFGGVLINAFKPIVTALNVVIGKFIQFAKVVSDSLGKIFGWTYNAGSGGGGVTSDLETGADAAEGISDGMGGAANNAKKLRQQLQGIDELNVLSSDKGSGGSGGSGGGAGGGSGASGTGGEWVQTESIFKGYESTLDSLYKLGDYIGTTLTKALNNIDWESVYEGARNFGSGLASFLNGLISPDLFGALGKTIAGAINTALHALNSFGETFEWKEFGVSIARGLTRFFETWDAKLTGETFSNFARGFLQSLTGFFETLSEDETFRTIGQKVVDFICGIDWTGLVWDFGNLAIALGKGIIDALDGFAKGSADKVKEKMAPVWKNLENWFADNFKFKTPDIPSFDEIIGDLKGFGNKTISIGISLFKKGWSSIGSFVGTSVNVLTKLKKKGWSTLSKFVGSSVNVGIKLVKSGWKKIKDWLGISSAFKLKFTLPKIKVEWGSKKVAGFTIKYPSGFKTYATGGFPEDGWFRANHGELMGKFDNGQTVVANNKQITQGIADAVYQGNRENNALMRQELELMRRQNDLLADILEKETGISANEIFRSVRKSAKEYRETTGRPAFSY